MRHYGLGQKWLLNFNAGKTQLVSFDQSNNTGAIDLKMHEEKSSFQMLGLTFSSKLDWGSCNTSIAKTAKSTKRPCMEYCCHVLAGAPSCYLELLDKLQKRICMTVGPSLPTSLEPLAHC